MINDQYEAHQHNGHETWWLYDARGIECAKVCDLCEAYVESTYRPDVMTNPGYWADEPIEPE